MNGCEWKTVEHSNRSTVYNENCHINVEQQTKQKNSLSIVKGISEKTDPAEVVWVDRWMK